MTLFQFRLYPHCSHTSLVGNPTLLCIIWPFRLFSKSLDFWDASMLQIRMLTLTLACKHPWPPTFLMGWCMPSSATSTSRRWTPLDQGSGGFWVLRWPGLNLGEHLHRRPYENSAPWALYCQKTFRFYTLVPAVGRCLTNSWNFPKGTFLTVQLPVAWHLSSHIDFLTYSHSTHGCKFTYAPFLDKCILNIFFFMISSINQSNSNQQ